MEETRQHDQDSGDDLFKVAPERTFAAWRSGNWRCRLLATTALGPVLLMASATAWANPTGGVVVGGDATIHHAPGVTTIDQASQSTIINWQQFSIAPGELTQFRQPGTNTIALNRVVGNDASQIMGALKANGQVWLINPNGILFGPNARVDVHGILATTTDIADRDFMTGRYDFNQPSPNPAASVVNQGRISIGEKGLGALVAPHVRNDGVIAGKLGHVVLAGAETFTLDFYGDGLVQFATTSEVKEALQEQGALVSNDGTISADGGTVLITVAAASDVVDEVINVSGIVEAKSVTMKDGAIVLDGGDSGIVHVAGTLDASGPGAGETGGTVKVLGEKVGLFDGAQVDASGDAGGGEVLIGGNYKGKGPERNAQRTVVFKKARVKADALRDGDGGRVIVWADETTSIQGALTARGGSISGNGGLIETSSRGSLSLTTTPDASALKGTGGTWLVDPTNITIDSEFADTISNAISSGTNFEINTNVSGSDSGNIIQIAPITKTAGGNTSLSFIANHDIIIIDNITSSFGALDIIIIADYDNNGQGSITIGNPAEGKFSIINSNGGDITGEANNSNWVGNGIAVNHKSILTTNAGGAVSLRGVGGTNAGNIGIIVDGGRVETQNGNINLIGGGTGREGSRNNDGISVFNGGVVVATGSGNISLVGNAGVGDIDNQGVAIGSSDSGLVSRVAVSTGNITAVGTGNGTGIDPVFGNFGVWAFDGGVIEVTGTGTISIQGAGSNNDPGIVVAANVFESGSSRISSGVGGASLTLTADEIDLAEGVNVSGSGLLQIQPLSPALPIVIGGNNDSGVGALDVTAPELSSLTDGFASITIGRDDSFGALTVAAAGVALNDPLVLRSPGTGGSIVVNGPVQVNGNALTLIAGTTADINADLTAFGADITITSGGTIDTIGSFVRSLSETGPGGNIALSAAGDIVTGGPLIAYGATSGGNVSLTSDNGSITLGDVIDAGARILDDGVAQSGSISLDTGGADVTLNGPIIGGSFSVSAGNNILINISDGAEEPAFEADIHTVSAGGQILNPGGGSFFSGLIILTAGDGIGTAEQRIFTDGPSTLRAGLSGPTGGIFVQHQSNAGNLDVESAFSPGGDVRIASLSDIIISGPVSAGGAAIELLAAGGGGIVANAPITAANGTAFLGTEGNITLNADIQARDEINIDAQNVTQASSAALIANQLVVRAGPEVSLNGPNQVNRAGGDAAGTFEFRNITDLVVDTPDSEAPWSFFAEEITLQIEGVLTVRKPIITFGPDTIVLNTQGFVNAFEGEVQALEPGVGRFLVYSTRRPSEDERGDLDEISDIVRGTFADNPPESITPAGENFFIYPDFGTLTFTAVDRPVEYGDLFVLPDPPLQDVDYTVRFSGGGELPVNPFSGEPALTSNPVVDEAGLLSRVGEFPVVIGLGSLASDFSLEFVNGKLEVRPAPLTVSSIAPSSASREYGDPNPQFDAEFSGFKRNDAKADLLPIIFNAPAADAVAREISYPISVTGFANPNYVLAPPPVQHAEAQLTITPAPLTIQADDASRPFAAPNPPFTATVTGFKFDDGPEVVTGLQFSTPAESSSPPGDYPIDPFGATAPNYSINFASGTLTIENIMPEVVPNSALSGIAIFLLSSLVADPDGGDFTGEAGNAGGITGLNVVFGMPETGALTEDEDLLFSSGGNESFWGPSAAP
jgi:filamentous hemagglutinin family protein